MSSQGVSYNGQCALSSVFPSIFSYVNTYTLMIKINDASAIRELVRDNDSFNSIDEVSDIFPKNYGNLFQCYIAVDGLDHLNGFYDFDDLLCGLGKISEGEYIKYKDELDDAKEKIDTFERFIIETTRELRRMDKENPTLERVLNEELSEMEADKNEIQYKKIQWEDQEILLEHISNNLRKCVFWLFFNENQQKQYRSGHLFKPRISTETIDLLDSIFNQTEQYDTITNKQLNQHITDYEVVNAICEKYQEQITEYGETVELLESTEEEEENESDEESVWETTSIDENENPDKSDASNESSNSSDSEDEDEPLKIDECKTCKNYAYLIEELRQKDKKIANLHEIIRAQDKQIEEHDEENDNDEENEWEAQYNGLKESYDEYIEEKNEEEKEHRKTIVDYALRVNALIDEVRELRKKQNLSTDNI